MTIKFTQIYNISVGTFSELRDKFQMAHFIYDKSEENKI